MWLVFAPVLTLVFAPMREAVRGMAQVHVLTHPERRRRFSIGQKRAIVAAAFAPGAIVADVARQADVCTSLVYRWRREIGHAEGFAEVLVRPLVDARIDHCRDDGGDDAGGVPAVATAAAAHSGAGEGSSLPAIEIEFSGASRVRIPASVPAELAAAVIAALRRR
ncbi:IS66-like element accessory protein TnpA [Defluviicoccus vanus]|nr:transposase [Defluviicoccus vanus]